MLSSNDALPILLTKIHFQWLDCLKNKTHIQDCSQGVNAIQPLEQTTQVIKPMTEKT
jgi:hypothetical protein